MIADTLLDAVRRDGGATVSWPDLIVPREGWAVADPTYSVTVPRFSETDTVTACAAISAYCLRIPAGRALGLWRDPETDTLWLDVVDIVHDHRRARGLGIARQQIAVYNLATGETMPCR